MRIIGGVYRGRAFKMPRGIRPTQDKVRKALFDILRNDTPGSSMLEFYAGSGAVGLEALSRGAKEVVFVEKNPVCFRIIHENLDIIKQKAKVLRVNANLAIRILFKNRKKFDIIFLDPPYGNDLAKKSLQLLGSYDILTPYGQIIVQHFNKDKLPQDVENLFLYRQSSYADTMLSFYSKGKK